MSNCRYVPLDHRALVAVSGDDRVAFLQGLVSADVAKAGSARAVYGALLTPQGKFLYDFFLGSQGDRLLIETEAEGRADFIQRLSRFRLRSKVALAAEDGLRPYALWGAEPAAQEGLVFADPRLLEAGWRAWLAAAPKGADPADFAEWDRHRIACGLPDGRRDMVAERTILLEAGFDELGGVDWDKGCFMGQEITARSKYRGQVRRRLMPVAIDGAPPEAGAPLFFGEEEAGEMRSHAGQDGLAMIRLDSFAKIAEAGGLLTAGAAKLTPRKPDWANFG